MAAGDYIPGSNLFGSGCKQVTYDPQITMEMVRTGKNQFSVVFRDGNTGGIVTDLPSFAVTFKNGPYSVTVMTVNGVATAVFTNLANGDVVGTAYGLTVSAAYSSIINYLFGNPDDPNSGGNDDPNSGGNSTNNNNGNGNGSGNTGNGPGSGSGNNQGAASNSGTSGSSSSSGASSASVGLATAAADAGSSGDSGQAGSNGQQSGQTKTAQELFVDDTTKNTQFWGILGVIVLIVLIFGGYYRKDLMSMIRRSKK